MFNIGSSSTSTINPIDKKICMYIIISLNHYKILQKLLSSYESRSDSQTYNTAPPEYYKKHPSQKSSHSGR